MCRVLFVFVVCLCLSAHVYALDVTSNFSVRGFYTLDATASDSNGAELPFYQNDPIETGEYRFDASHLGLQLDYFPLSSLSITLQGIASAQSNNSVNSSLEWAYASYELGKDLYLRGGKMKISFLQGTELRYVGFSRLWARPLIPNSGAGGFDDYVGGEMLKSLNAFGYNLRFQAAAGIAEHQRDFVKNRYIGLFSTRIEKSESWLTLSLLQAGYDLNTPFGDELLKAANLYMASLESEVNLGRTVVNLGLAQSDSVVNPDEFLAYLSLGYRMKRFTPFVFVSEKRISYDASEFPDDMPAPPGSPPRPNGTDKSDTLALGCRYDLGSTYALKFQFEHWIKETNSRAPDPASDTAGNLYTLTFEGAF